MALKDWKKVNGEDTFNQWYRKDNTSLNVFVYLQDYAEEAYGYKKKSEWVYEVHKERQTIREKAFDTKSEAMKFAKDYMRRH